MPQRPNSVKPRLRDPEPGTFGQRGSGMEHFDLAGAPPVRVHVRRSRAARRMSLRVSRLDGRITLTLPPGARLASGRAFAEERAAWLRRHLTGLPEPHFVDVGRTLPVEGAATPITRGPRTEWRADPGEIAVSARTRHVGAAVEAVLKDLARERLVRASDSYAERLGQAYSRLSLRDTRSRWGSCSSNGALMYSWRLVMAPPEVLDYVAAHEVAHLSEMNHGPKFWQTVEHLCPDFATHRSWLRREGHALHRYRFRPD